MVKDRLHPLLPPSLLSVEPPEHTRYRKMVSSVFTTRAVAALRERVEDGRQDLIDGLADGGAATVDIVDRYCSQLPVTVIGDIIGVPDHDRPRILRVRRAGRTQPGHRPALGAVPAGRARARRLQHLAGRPHPAPARQPRRRSDESAHRRQRRRRPAQRRGAAGHRRPGARRGLRDDGQPAGQRHPHPAGASRPARHAAASSPTCGRAPSRRSCGWSRRCR